jgi:hypothetical protein
VNLTIKNNIEQTYISFSDIISEYFLGIVSPKPDMNLAQRSIIVIPEFYIPVAGARIPDNPLTELHEVGNQDLSHVLTRYRCLEDPQSAPV